MCEMVTAFRMPMLMTIIRVVVAMIANKKQYAGVGWTKSVTMVLIDEARIACAIAVRRKIIATDKMNHQRKPRLGRVCPPTPTALDQRRHERIAREENSTQQMV